MSKTLKVNTAEIKSFCSTFNSKMASIDLGSLDVANAFEPFTSQGILTSYVSSLKEALSTITEKSASITTVLQQFADTQENIDSSGKVAARANTFNNNTNVNPTSYGNRNGNNYQSPNTSANNGNSFMSLNHGDNLEAHNIDNNSLVSFENLSTLLDRELVGTSDEEFVSYLEELEKVKIQAYLTKLESNKITVEHADECITYDVLKAISEELNIQLVDILNKDNIEDVRDKVESLSQRYIDIFNSNNLNTDLKNIYDGNNVEEQDKEFVDSIKGALDVIALKSNMSVDELLKEENEDKLKLEIDQVKVSIEKLKSAQTNEEFITLLREIFNIDIEKDIKIDTDTDIKKD